MSNQNTGKRLAKNTALMYVRMVVTLVIAFYTSRVVLQKLGVEDFGIYNVVGSIIVMFASLRTLISSATQRYLNYEMGRGHNDRLRLVFNMSIYINVIISLVFLLVVEVVGVWFLNTTANIPESRELAAMLVFQFSVISAIVSVFTTSYDAVIIAHERMDFFAYMSIFEGILKLAVVYLIAFIPGDNLSNYGWLLLVATVIIFIANAVYAHMKFDECKYEKIWEKQLFEEMIAFSGWNFFGKASMALTQSGLNMLLNVFGGPIVNAARGIAFQLNSATNQFINNVNVVLDPFFIRTYAEGRREAFFGAFHLSSKLLYFIQLCLVIPLSYLADLVLKIWLGQVPEYSVVFLQLILVWSLLRAPHSPIDKYFKAVGKIKNYQILEGVVLALPLPVSYFTLKFGMGFSSVFVMMIIFEAINLYLIVKLAGQFQEISIAHYVKLVLLPCIIVTIPYIVGMLVTKTVVLSIVERLLISLVILMLTIVLFYIVGLNKNEKVVISGIIRKQK